jgi:hypothetical protein
MEADLTVEVLQSAESPKSSLLAKGTGKSLTK